MCNHIMYKEVIADYLGVEGMCVWGVSSMVLLVRFYFKLLYFLISKSIAY